MANSDGSLTLEGLAQTLRDHMDGTSARFAEVAGVVRDLGQIVRRNTEQIGIVGGLVQNLAQVVTRHDDQIEEHRQYIRQIFSRMEQHDARFEAMNQEIREIRLEIRQILDAMEHRGGDGGGREQ